jgi:hypothetical protein
MFSLSQLVFLKWLGFSLFRLRFFASPANRRLWQQVAETSSGTCQNYLQHVIHQSDKFRQCEIFTRLWRVLLFWVSALRPIPNLIQP